MDDKTNNSLRAQEGKAMNGSDLFKILMQKNGVAISEEQSIRLENFIAGMISVHEFIKKERDDLRAKLAAMESQTVPADKPAVAVPDDWRDAAQEFVDRCEQGSIRSRYTYAKFKALLEAAPSHSQQSEVPHSDFEVVQKALSITSRMLYFFDDGVCRCDLMGPYADMLKFKNSAELLAWAKGTIDSDRCPSHESEGKEL